MQPKESTQEHTPSPSPAGKNPQILLQILPVVFHKLKNKLTPILGYAQILKSTTTSPADASRLEKIERGALDFTLLLNKLRDYFQQEKRPRTRACLSTVIRDLEGEIMRQCTASEASLSLQLDPALPEAPLYTDELSILLLEMVDNALRSLQRKGGDARSISITTHALAEGFELRIRDSGEGVRPEDEDKIWTPFFSTDPERAGLGLVLCEKIIANHQAEATLSTAVGEYTEFVIRFPPPDGQ